MNWLAHLTELRKRLLNCFIATSVIFIVLFYFSDHLFNFLAVPLLGHLAHGQTIIATAVSAPLLTPLKLSFAVSFFIAIPYVLMQVWLFIAPALYKQERRLLWLLLFISTLLFYLGMTFAYFVVFPLVFGLFVSVVPSAVTMMPDMSQYLDFCLKLFFAFGAAFEVPIVTVLVIYSGIASAETLKQQRPYIIVGAFVLGMVLTPPDVISQVLLAIPIWLLFELGLVMAKLLNAQALSEQDLSEQE